MRRTLTLPIAAALMLTFALPATADTARRYRTYERGGTDGAARPKATTIAATPPNAGWDKGRTNARKDFQRKSGFPRGRPGYVVDYVVPLSQGGEDSPSNMRWVPIDEIVSRRPR